MCGADTRVHRTLATGSWCCELKRSDEKTENQLWWLASGPRRVTGELCMCPPA